MGANGSHISATAQSGSDDIVTKRIARLSTRTPRIDKHPRISSTAKPFTTDNENEDDGEAEGVQDSISAGGSPLQRGLVKLSGLVSKNWTKAEVWILVNSLEYLLTFR